MSDTHISMRLVAAAISFLFSKKVHQCSILRKISGCTWGDQELIL